MRISEAADILGVDRNADKQTIDKAARQQIRKWHPDRWRSASDADQKRAAREYSKVSKAQQVMQHPEMADPEIEDIAAPSGFDFNTPSYSANQPSHSPAYRNGDSAQPGVDPFGSMFSDSARDSRRVKYNEATSFEDSFGVVPDTMEQMLNMMQNDDTERQYRQFADIMKISMSVISSLVMLFVSFVLLLGSLNIVNVAALAAEGSLGDGIASIFPATSKAPSIFTFGILSLFALVKIFTYDSFLAPLIAQRSRSITPSILCGVDIVICGIVGYAVSSLWPVPRIMYGCMVLMGALFIAGAFFVRIHREGE